jgi:hypothetical protein
MGKRKMESCLDVHSTIPWSLSLCYGPTQYFAESTGHCEKSMVGVFTKSLHVGLDGLETGMTDWKGRPARKCTELTYATGLG